LAFLWFQIARVGYRASRATTNPTRQTLLLGILTGLLVVFIDGWVYQNLEVKQVNAYFWTLVGCVAFLSALVRSTPTTQELAPAPTEASASVESATEPPESDASADGAPEPPETNASGESAIESPDTDVSGESPTERE
jgi:hypothetical protein